MSTPNTMEPCPSSRVWSRPGTVVRPCQHVARLPSQLERVFGNSQDWVDRLIEDTTVDTAVTRVRLQRPIRDQGVPTDAIDDRRAETCSPGPTLAGSNREGLNCVSLTKHQRRRAVYMSGRLWDVIIRTWLCQKRDGRADWPICSACNMGKSTRTAATRFKSIRR